MTPFGWRLLGGPYPELGTDRLTPLGWALAWLLVAVSGIDVLIGRWLWQGRRSGAILALLMAPASFALGRLFVLPYLLIMTPVRVIATLLAWRDLPH
jgi:cytochrome b subunit of formate dehydrogenase